MELTLNTDLKLIKEIGLTKWYSIKAYIVSSDENQELNNIEKVEYLLDPSFEYPVMVSINPDNNFLIEAESWKPIPLKAKVSFKDKGREPILLKYEE